MRLCSDLVGKWVQVYSVEAGLFVGVLRDAERNSVLLGPGARRVWSWEGAATRSQLANEGPKGGKMPAPCDTPTVVLGVCEIQGVTEKALAAYAAVPVWSA